jgi:cytochrome c peroxidase
MLSRCRALPICGGAILLAAGVFTRDSQAADAPHAFAVVHPDNNPSSPEKISLGKQLFFDKRLSQDNSISCATCHDPAKGFSNGEPFATGVGKKVGGRNSPTVINSAFQTFQFWDGRAGSLEEQALGPMQNPIEMNMKLEQVVERLNAIDGYKSQFQKIFKTDATSETIGKAIAAYERTLISMDAPFDRHEAGDKNALTPAAKRGRDLFFGRANCSACHAGHNFTDNAFHNVGIGMDKPTPDVGREAISKLEGDRGSFKTPTLREVARSAPYMHDGSLKSLDEVVNHYSNGGIKNRWLDEELFPLNLTDAEKKDLVAFLKEGLSSESYPAHTAPELPK